MYDIEKFSRALASVETPRSRFSRPSSGWTTFNNGELVPIYCDAVLPGDTFDMKGSLVCRLSNPLKTPIMSDIFLDVYFFFVPNRLVWDHWVNFMFENTDSKWFPTTEYTIPQITSPEGGWKHNTIAHHLGVRMNTDGLSVNALRIRAYCEIYNEWFRDENLVDPVLVYKGDATVAGSNGNDEVNDACKGGQLLHVSRFHDVLSTASISPQKGPDVILPLGDNANVYFGSNDISMNDYVTKYGRSVPHFKFGKEDLSQDWGIQSGTILVDNTGGAGMNTVSSGQNHAAYITNAYADLGSATATTINNLRQAFSLQRFYERLNIGGSRYTETIRAFFGVISDDARLQRPEYLCGTRIPINVNQVLQNSDDNEKLGQVGAYSLTFSSSINFLRSFKEHGYVIGLCCARHTHVYQQGMERDFFKEHFTDYYFPVFNNIGEQPVYNSEIFAQGNNDDKEVFGYQEPWYDSKYKMSYVHGMFASDYSLPLDSWHLADDYSTLPTLSKAWLEEGKESLNRVLINQDDDVDQYLCNFSFNLQCSRCMSLYSVPGLENRF